MYHNCTTIVCLTISSVAPRNSCHMVQIRITSELLSSLLTSHCHVLYPVTCRARHHLDLRTVRLSVWRAGGDIQLSYRTKEKILQPTSTFFLFSIGTHLPGKKPTPAEQHPLYQHWTYHLCHNDLDGFKHSKLLIQ